METYKAPDVHIEDVSVGARTSEQASASVCMMIGVTRNGIVGVPQKVTSWTEYINKFANGLDTPFIENDYLSYAVHGFYANGGRQLYIGSIKKSGVKATVTSTTSGIKFTAASEGFWGNDIKVQIAKNSDFDEGKYETYDITVSVGVVDSITIADLAPEDFPRILNNSKVKNWLGDVELPTAPGEGSSYSYGEETVALAGGSDGTALTDADYVSALEMAAKLDDLTMIGIPGQTSSTVNSALIKFCDEHGLFPFLDMPMSSTVEDTRQYRKTITAWTGELAFPWGRMIDPLTGNLKSVPTCGHLMGVYARTIENVGIQKAPAGINATVNGFVELEYAVTPEELGDLNSAGVVTIMTRPNAGIVVWGARSLNSKDSDLKYVTDGIINLNIKKSLYNSTQYAVFEPNDTTLWSNVKATCVGLLETLRSRGVLKGTSEEAYYVIVDESNNTEDTVAEGYLYIDIGYAPVKPAEFIVIRLAHAIVA